MTRRSRCAARRRCEQCGSPSTGRALGGARESCLAALRALLAIASEKDGAPTAVVHAERLDAALAQPRPGRPTYCDFDHSGATVAVMQEGMGIYLGPAVPRAGRAAREGVAGAAAAVPVDHRGDVVLRVVEVAPAAGDWHTTGKVIIFNKAEGVMQLHDKKHGAAVTCGDWLSDNRLGLASATAKVSSRCSRRARSGSRTQVQAIRHAQRAPRKFKTAGAPKLLSFSRSFAASRTHRRQLHAVFGTSSAKADEDVGLTFPEDCRSASVARGQHDARALANGYVTTVDFGAMVRMRHAGAPQCAGDGDDQASTSIWPASRTRRPPSGSASSATASRSSRARPRARGVGRRHCRVHPLGRHHIDFAPLGPRGRAS